MYKTWTTEDFKPLREGDLTQMVKDFHPSLIVLNPKYERFAKEADCEVRYQDNVMLWEVWFIAPVITAPTITVAPVAQNLTGIPSDTANPLSDIAEKMLALSKEKNRFNRPLSSREISKRLSEEGIKISHETVWRKLGH